MYRDFGFSCYDGGKKPYDFFSFLDLSSGRYRPPYIQKLAKSYVRGAVQPPKFDFIPIKLVNAIPGYRLVVR